MYTYVSWPGVYLSLLLDWLLHGVYGLGGIQFLFHVLFLKRFNALHTNTMTADINHCRLNVYKSEGIRGRKETVLVVSFHLLQIL
jgi:hypothetical protein